MKYAATVKMLKKYYRLRILQELGVLYCKNIWWLNWLDMKTHFVVLGIYENDDRNKLSEFLTLHFISRFNGFSFWKEDAGAAGSDVCNGVSAFRRREVSTIRLPQ